MEAKIEIINTQATRDEKIGGTNMTHHQPDFVARRAPAEVTGRNGESQKEHRRGPAGHHDQLNFKVRTPESQGPLVIQSLRRACACAIGWVACLLCGSGNLAPAAEPARRAFDVAAEPAIRELSPEFCWFHPRAAAIPAAGKDGKPAVVMTLMKHLAADDHYSGLYFLRTDDHPPPVGTDATAESHRRRLRESVRDLLGKGLVYFSLTVRPAK